MSCEPVKVQTGNKIDFVKVQTGNKIDFNLLIFAQIK